MQRCSAVKSAAQHTQHLMRQGKPKSEAIQHAVQRFGVTHGAIIREIRSWHEFSIPSDAYEDEAWADAERLIMARAREVA